jgi:hypothetical protein
VGYSRSLLGILGLVLAACGAAPEHPPSAGTDEAPATPVGELDEQTLPSNDDHRFCQGVEAPTERLPVDLFIVVDRSDSMSDATADGASKWSATKSALRDVLLHVSPTMGIGLSFFPSAGHPSSCMVSDHVEDAVPIDGAAQTRDVALALLERVNPDGSTPTAPALSAALQLAGAHGQAHPDRSVVVVLATDGKPTACAPTDAASLATLAGGALAGPGHVRTMVVSFTSLADDASEMDALWPIALAGGTQHPIVIDPRGDFAAQLSTALGETASRRVACDLALPEPAQHQDLDYDRVNVVVEADGRTTLSRVDGPEACGARGGWYYDVDPKLAAPSRLDICPSTCAEVGSHRASQLKVELGCKTRLR